MRQLFTSTKHKPIFNGVENQSFQKSNDHKTVRFRKGMYGFSTEGNLTVAFLDELRRRQSGSGPTDLSQT
jgi:hypothetical protein